MAEAPATAVHACSVADPFVVLLMEDGRVELLTLEVGKAEEEVGGAEEEVGEARLVQSTPDLGEVRRNDSSDCSRLLT